MKKHDLIYYHCYTFAFGMNEGAISSEQLMASAESAAVAIAAVATAAAACVCGSLLHVVLRQKHKLVTAEGAAALPLHPSNRAEQFFAAMTPASLQRGWAMQNSVSRTRLLSCTKLKMSSGKVRTRMMHSGKASVLG